MEFFPNQRFPPPPFQRELRQFRPAPPQNFSPFALRQPANPHLDYINLRRTLESQKNATRINLNDSYIRDEGCTILAEFLMGSPHISQLELKGNNITAKGLAMILDSLKQNFKLRSLNLEWNSIGLDPSGVEALSGFLSQNTSLNHLDLRNNRITSNDAQNLANLIHNSKSLVSLDLRWNEIGNLGAKAILAALKENPILQVLELSGNNVSEELLREMLSVLEKNRDKYPFLEKSLNDRQMIPGSSDKNEEQEKTDFIKRLEKELQDERNLKLELQGKFDEEFQRQKSREFELNKIIHDLELKAEKFLSENKSLKQSLDRISMELDVTKANNSEMAKINEVRIGSFEKDLGESEKRHRLIIEKLTEESELRLREVSSEYEDKLRSFEERNKELQKIRSDLENDLKRAVETGAKLKIAQEDQIRELEYKLGEQENMRYTAHLKSLEGRMKVVEEARESLNKKNADLIREIKELESHRVDNSSRLEREIQEYKEENESLSQKIKELETESERMRTEIKMKDNLVEKLEHEINDLNEIIESFKKENKEQLQELYSEHREEIKTIQAEKDVANAKVFELQNSIRNCTGENLRLRHDYQRLADLLQSALNRSVLETFSANNFI